MAIPITSLSTTKVPITGGMEIVVLSPGGTYTIGASYRVYLGPAGNDTDEQCYSGVSGQGRIAKSLDGDTLAVVSPICPRGAVILSVYSATDSGTLGGIEAIEDAFFDIQWTFRRNWSSCYDVGARDLDMEPRQDA